MRAMGMGIRPGRRRRAVTGAGAALALEFRSGVLDPRIEFTRASTATYTDSKGQLATALSDVARFDCDPVTFAPKGLLIETQRTNLLTYSEQLENVAWSKNGGAGITAVAVDAAIAPDGTGSADRLYNADTALNYHYASQSPTLTLNVTYTLTCFAKYVAGSGIVYLIGEGATGDIFCYFNVQTGVVTQSTGFDSARIIPYPNGWYRLEAVFTKGTSTAAETVGIGFCAATGTPNFAAEAASQEQVYIWGVQLEAGGFSTSYIPTAGSTVTRAADSVALTGAGFSSWYNQAEGTFVIDVDTFGGHPFNVNDGTTSNRIALYGLVNVLSVTGGVIDVNMLVGAATAGVRFKVAMGYAANNFGVSLNGGAAVTDTLAAVPTVDRLRIGSDQSAGSIINGHVRSLTYYKTRLSDAQLQAATV